MSGAEAIIVLGVISSIISIIDGTKQVYDAAANAEGLPSAFREVAGRLPIVQNILRTANQHLKEGSINNISCEGMKPIVEACKQKAMRLNELFQKVLPADKAPRAERYLKAARTLGKGNRVELLMKGILEDVQLLASNYGMQTATKPQLEQIAKDIAGLSAIPPLTLISEDSQFLPSDVIGNNYVYHVNPSARQSIYDWISNIPYWSHHSNMLKDLLKNSGKWFLESREFREWSSPDLARSEILWLHGIPGSGKSRLIACAVEHLRYFQGYRQCNFAYFYCLRGTSEAERSDPEELLRSLLRQLAFSDDPPNVMKQPVAKLYKSNEARAKARRHELEKFTIPEIITLLTEILKGVSTTIVIDALDELDRIKRDSLFRTFNAILKDLEESKEGGVVRLLISSRDDQDIVQQLSGYQNISIAIKNQDDIVRFVDDEVRKAIEGNAFLRREITEELRHKIEYELKNKAQGMFRWVDLQINFLFSAKSSSIVKKRLNSLPRGLAESYDLIYTQICDDEDELFVANRVLSWLLYAKKQLSIPDFIKAICHSCHSSSTFSNDELTKESLLHICQNLVVEDESLQIFRVAHLSVTEYFESRESFHPNTSNAIILDTCIALLDAKSNASNMSVEDSVFQYAGRYWVHHCEGLGPEGPPEPLKRHLSSFIHHEFKPSASFKKWASLVWGREFNDGLTSLERYKIEDSAQLTAFPCFLIAALGILWLLQDGFNIQASDWLSHHPKGDTPMVVAGIWGQKAVVKYLLSKGVHADNRGSISVPGSEHRTALHMAARHGHVDLIQYLLENGADINDRKQRYRCAGNTPLHEAAQSGDIQVIKCLLDHGANTELWNASGKTPLYYADNLPGAAQLLIDRGACTANKSIRNDLALQRITISDVLSILFEHNAGLSGPQNDESTSPIPTSNYMDVLKPWLSKLQTSEIQLSQGEKSLTNAIMANSIVSVRVLLEYGLDVNTMGEGGKRPLDLALELADPEILAMLLTEYHAEVGLKWDYASVYIQRWSKEMWFHILLSRISPRMTQELYIERFLSVAAVCHEEKLFTENSPDIPYVQVIVPPHFQEIQGIEIHIISHDQGYSHESDEWGGSYVKSCTWFEIVVKRALPPDQTPQNDHRQFIGSNVHASSNWRLQRHIWDVQDSTRREWLNTLAPGDTLQVMPKAKYPGWENHVSSMKIIVYGNESID